MRYRKTVRADVREELIGHFEDALRKCETDEDRQKLAGELIIEFGDAAMLAKLIRRGKTRCRPLWRTVVARSFQVIGLLYLWLICYCVYISFAQPTLKVDYIARMNSLTQPPAGENLNAAPLYDRAIELFVEPPAIEKTGKEPLLSAIDDKQKISELTQEELSLLKDYLSKNSQALAVFKQGSERPHCWWKRENPEDEFMLWILLPELDPLKSIARLTCWQAKLKARDGQIQAAFDDLLACYRVGWHLRGPRTLIEQVVGIALQALAVENSRVVLSTCKIDERLLMNFQQHIEDVMPSDSDIADFQVERFMIRDMIQRCFTDDGKGSGRMIPRMLTNSLSGDGIFPNNCELALALISANRKKMTDRFEGLYDKMQVWATMTPWQINEENVHELMESEFEGSSNLEKVRYFAYYILTPVMLKVSETPYRLKVQTEGLVTTIALLRYYEETEQYPENLSQLTEAGYMEDIPMDPYSDGPLVYRRTEDGFTLYSVGMNFKDDGGKPGRYKYGTFWLWQDEGDAVLWPVEYSKIPATRKQRSGGLPGY